MPFVGPVFFCLFKAKEDVNSTADVVTKGVVSMQDAKDLFSF